MFFRFHSIQLVPGSFSFPPLAVAHEWEVIAAAVAVGRYEVWLQWEPERFHHGCFILSCSSGCRSSSTPFRHCAIIVLIPRTGRWQCLLSPAWALQGGGPVWTGTRALSRGCVEAQARSEQSWAWWAWG